MVCDAVEQIADPMRGEEGVALETITRSVSDGHSELDGNSTGLGTFPAALIKLEEETGELATIVGATGYAVCRTRRFARDEQDRVTIVFSRIDDAMRDVLSVLGQEVQRHMDRSLLPFSWPATAEDSVAATGFIRPLLYRTSGPGGVGFPVRLGIMGNGFVVFFGPHMDLSGDRIVECHREAYRLLRGILKLDVDTTTPHENLNDRELQCLQLAADGYKSEAIAAQLQLSVHTVNAYMGFAADKLNAVNRIQAIAKAIRLGLIG